MEQSIRLSELQRARLLSAITDAACERGAGNVTASDVVAKAGVSRRTFYELFSSCEECLLAAIDDAIGRVADHVRPAYEAAEDWQAKTRNGLTAMLDFFDMQPMVARLLIVEMLAAGPQARARRSTVLATLADVVGEGGKASDERAGRQGAANMQHGRSVRERQGARKRGLPGLTGTALVGGVLSVLYEQLANANPGRLGALAPELAGFIVLPYLGVAACRRELERPPVKPRGEAAPGGEEQDAAHRLVKDAALRLTARTIMMLAAVAEHPGSSNRMLAEHAGMRDQGQASKLLMRLQARGLVENATAAAPRGAPNSWRLTARGGQLQELVERRAGGVQRA